MNEQMLQQYLAAESEEERAWISANALLETQPPDIREAVIAAAVPHWFDAEILAALLQSGVETSVRVSGVETPAYTPTPFQGEESSRSDDGIEPGVSTPGIPPPIRRPFRAKTRRGATTE